MKRRKRRRGLGAAPAQHRMQALQLLARATATAKRSLGSIRRGNCVDGLHSLHIAREDFGAGRIELTRGLPAPGGRPWEEEAPALNAIDAATQAFMRKCLR